MSDLAEDNPRRRLTGGRRCGIQSSDWRDDWWTSWNPRYANDYAEGSWSDWVELARRILDADEQAREKESAR